MMNQTTNNTSNENAASHGFRNNKGQKDPSVDNLINNFNYLQINNNAYDPLKSNSSRFNNNTNTSTTTTRQQGTHSPIKKNASSSSIKKSSSNNGIQQSSQPTNNIQYSSSTYPNSSSPQTVSSPSTKKTISYSAIKVIGNGSFGVVFLAKVQETGEVVAIKKVLQDKRFKNRELQVMKTLSHPNIVELKHHFYSRGDRDPEEIYLNLVLEYIPDTVYRFCMNYTKHNTFMPMIYVKLFTYQLLRSLVYIHSMGICHRDIKPQNLLIDPVTGVLKLCDFGNAKQLKEGEPNVSYICSRYYRAPELIFQSTKYTLTVDLWSTGCVMGELLLGQPLFQGENSVDQLVEIIQVMGAPTKQEILAMNKNYIEFKFPPVKPQSLDKLFAERYQYIRNFQGNIDPTLEMNNTIDLISKLLQYDPRKRIPPMDALAHPFFDELRLPNIKLPNGKPLPSNLFNFTEQEWSMLQNPELRDVLVPSHARISSAAPVTSTSRYL
ncbi:hypothetical protein ABK040_005410 [Willaertia magna]